MTNKLYVANISFRAVETDLETLFKGCGQVDRVRLVYGDRGHKGFGFVEMADAETAKRAIDQLNGSMFMERDLHVDYARERASRDDQPRGDRNSGGGGWDSNSRGGVAAERNPPERRGYGSGRY